MVTPLIEARGIRKSFGHVHALQGANLTVYPNEIVALVGDNGAGKSTLIKTISGVLTPDSGQIFVDGQEVRLSSPLDARAAGIETVYQDLALAAQLNPVANMYLGREVRRRGLLGRLGVLDNRKMRSESEQTFTGLGVKIPDLSATVANMSGGQRQGIAICRAINWASRVVIMDEPTAALGVTQTANVLTQVKRVRELGMSVVLISHNMPEIFEVADRIEVMHLGRRVAVLNTREASMEDVVAAMTGARVDPAVAHANGKGGSR
jgi:simple sugar transport system ATP-binding protein